MKELQAKSVEEEKSKQEKVLQEKKRTAYLDSLSNSLLLEYPKAYNSDSIKMGFSYLIQEQLSKSSNLLFLNNCTIQNIEKLNDKYVVTTITYLPKIVGKFSIDSQLFGKLRQKTRQTNWSIHCSFIIDVKKLIPINSRIVNRIEDLPVSLNDEPLTEDQISDYVEIDIATSPLTSYLVLGDVIDFRVIE